jgi:hypothetical protein
MGGAKGRKRLAITSHGRVELPTAQQHSGLQSTQRCTEGVVHGELLLELLDLALQLLNQQLRSKAARQEKMSSKRSGETRNLE